MLKKNSAIKKLSKKKMLLCSIVLFIILVTTVIGVFVLQFYIRDFSDIKDDKDYDKYYVLITEDRKSEFWKSVYQGAFDEGQEQGVYVEMLGDNLSEDYTKEDLMKIAIASNVSGIIVDGDEGSTMTALINEATEANIPVITAYNDNTRSKRLSFVGMGSYNMGRVYGRQILQIAGKVKAQGIGRDDGICKVAVLVTAYADRTWQNILVSGIQDTINKDTYEGSNVKIDLVPVNNTTTFSSEESIRDIFMQEELPDIIVCLNEVNTACVLSAVVDYNKVGKVRVLGYYDLDSTLTAVERGVADATISIDTEQIGRYCVEALQEYYLHGKVSEYFAADVFLINANNVSEYQKGEKDEDKTN